MTEALDIVIIIIASGLGIGLGWLLAKMKFSTELVRAEVEAQAGQEGRVEDGVREGGDGRGEACKEGGEGLPRARHAQGGGGADAGDGQHEGVTRGAA